MKRPLLISFVLLISKFALCQTPIQSFKSQPLPDMQGFNQSQIDSFISKASIENFRLDTVIGNLVNFAKSHNGSR